MDNDERIVSLLEELVAWTRFSAREGLKSTLQDVLADPKHFRAYELTDGTRTQKQVAESVGLSQPAVSNLWQRWRRLGIVREISNGRPAHLARPAELGLVAMGSADAVESNRSRRLDNEETSEQ
jgi:hypothetical protein